MSVPITSPADTLTETWLPGKEREVLAALHANVRTLFLPEFKLPDSSWKMVSLDGLSREEWEQMLLRRCPEVLLTGWNSFPIPLSLLELDPLPLRYICHMAGSVRSLVPRSFIDRGLLVSNWSTTINHTVAEHAILLVLGALRSLPAWRSYYRNPQERNLGYGSELQTLSLKGRRVGLHGIGGVAREIIARLRPFDVEISAWSKDAPQRLFEDAGVRRAPSLEALFASSEVLIECEALTSATRGMVSGRVLDLLPNNAVFVNVGRGSVVEEAALIRLAESGRVRVAVDVMQAEPLPVDSPLLELPNMLISPHIAGPTSDAYQLCGNFALGNITRYLRGERVEGAVSLEIYDRST